MPLTIDRAETLTGASKAEAFGSPLFQLLLRLVRFGHRFARRHRFARGHRVAHNAPPSRPSDGGHLSNLRSAQTPTSVRYLTRRKRRVTRSSGSGRKPWLQT